MNRREHRALNYMSRLIVIMGILASVGCSMSAERAASGAPDQISILE